MLSYKVKILSLLLISMLFLSIGCKKTFDINQDPNNPTLDVGTPKIVFPVAAMGVAAVSGGDLAILGGIFGEQLTQAAASGQYKNIDQYDMKTTDNNAQYTTIFAYGLKNAQFVIDKAKQSEDWSFYLMGTVIKAYAAELLVDLYDQIPYTEALQGSSNLNPHFDDGYSIYKALLDELDTALSKDFDARTVTDLRATGEGNVDIVFGGDIQKWIQFANTLELKMYLRMINAKPAEAQKGVEDLYARNATFLSSDAAVTGFIDAASQSNPLFEQNIRQLNTPGNLVGSTTYVSFLKENNDPRIVTFFGSNSAVSLDQGDYLNTSSEALSAAVFKQTPIDPVVFLSSAESYFLQAEARARYFAGSGAKSRYEQGVLAAFSSVGEDGTSFIAPGGAYEYPSGTLSENIEAIIVQKWASLPYGDHFIEGWFDKLRTGYPKTSSVYSTDPSYIPGQFVVSKNSVLPPGQFPKRQVFPDVEISRNPNTPALVPITTPVWWGL
ncbi:MAG: SusD/RagB family nutrient-binding outer membrane lipoprotein [Ginsengibacter sp.]